MQNLLGVGHLHFHLSFVAPVLFNRFVCFEIFYLLLDLCGFSHQQVWDLRNKVLLAVVLIVFQGLFERSECPVRDIRWDLELEVSYV